MNAAQLETLQNRMASAFYFLDSLERLDLHRQPASVENALMGLADYAEEVAALAREYAAQVDNSPPPGE